MDDELYKLLGGGGIAAVLAAFGVRWLYNISNNHAGNSRSDIRAIQTQEILNDNLMSQIQSLQTRLDAANAEANEWREKYYAALRDGSEN